MNKITKTIKESREELRRRLYNFGRVQQIPSISIFDMVNICEDILIKITKENIKRLEGERKEIIRGLEVMKKPNRALMNILDKGYNNAIEKEINYQREILKELTKGR